MNRRGWRAWAPAALVTLALSCAHRHAAKPHELAFWVSWPVEAIQPLARRFEAENPGIHVNLVPMPWLSGADSVAAAVKAGTPPDLCQLHDGQMPPFMADNSLSDWSAGVADLRAGLRGWDMVMLGDAIYGLPWLLRTQVLYFNRSLLARAGLDSTHAPASWGQVHAAAASIHRLRAGEAGFGMCSGASESPLKRLMPFAYGGGGDVVDSSQPEMPSFDAPLYAMTLEMLTTLRQVSVLASEDSLELLFVKGHLGLLLAGSELATRIAREAPTLRYGMGLVPGNNPGDGRHISVAGGEVLVSLTESRRKEDALKLARYLVRPENAHALATALQIVQPANLGADTTAWYRARPEQQLMFRQYETARFLPYFRGRIALEDTLTTLIDDALDGRRSAAEAVALADSFIAKHVGPR